MQTIQEKVNHFLGKINGPLKEQTGDMTVCGKVFLRVVSASSFFSCNKSQSFLVDETTRLGIYENRVPLENLFLRG